MIAAYMVTVEDDFESQAFPKFGSERRGGDPRRGPAMLRTVATGDLPER